MDIKDIVFYISAIGGVVLICLNVIAFVINLWASYLQRKLEKLQKLGKTLGE